nr:unnamed protein product [Callosobruchus analis]
MTRNRFEYIKGVLHCCNNNNLDPDDRFAKVRPLFEKLKAPISQNHSVDEALVPYYGHLGAKQFLRGKPIRYGYKLCAGTTPEGYRGGGRSNIFDLPFCFYFDNFFTSLSLIVELTKRNIGTVETIRKNRIGSSDLKSDKQLQTERGSWNFKVTEDKFKIVIKWTDNGIFFQAVTHRDILVKKEKD